MTLTAIAIVALGIATALLSLGCYRLFIRNGRLMLRVEELETRLKLVGSAPPPIPALPNGLPPGSGAMDFELPDTSGILHTLSQWRDRRVLLIFIDPACPFSQQLIARLGDLPATGRDDSPMPLLVSRGELEDNRRLVAEYHLQCPVLIQEAMEVAFIYQVRGTPMGHLIDEDGTIVSPLTAGAGNLLSLVMGGGLAAVTAAASAEIPDVANGVSPTQPSLPRPTLTPVQPGTQAPAFRLPSVAGEEVALDAYRGRELLLIFSDLDCTHCRRLAPLLETYHRQATGRAVIMICRGDPEAVRDYTAHHYLTFPVALQGGWEVSRKYGALATPVGFVIDQDGRIVSRMAGGVEAILALTTPARAASDRKEGTPAAV